ncbi:MAG TPA: SDR family NAD(P)-dependent oxidoreductase [Solirubrobacteraceae bacterium]|nr:SDR family NAD(P)-dependent oxidoreductase [Solirubrobacteraceae bacterium]
MSREDYRLEGRRVVITGAARGIGARLARRLHERGAVVALIGLEPELLGAVAADCGNAPWFECDVSDRAQVDEAVRRTVERLGGLDVAVANAGVGAQMVLIDGDDQIWDKTFAVNLMGSYNLVRAAGPHVAHRDGYFLLTASLAAALHLPLMSAYSASKAAVESLGDSLRIELRPTGAKVGVAYYSELDTDMTSRGFGTEAAKRTLLGAGRRRGLPVAPVGPAIDALERGIRRRSRRVVSPPWVAAILPIRMLVQRVVEVGAGVGLRETLEVARGERPDLTTPQPSAAVPEPKEEAPV